MTNLVDVSVLSFAELFDQSPLPLAVDTYQRGFVWNDEKITQLATDLTDYQSEQDPKPPYYMGSVLIHRHQEKAKHFIIDGQQRLTALCVLYQKLNSTLPKQCALTFSPKSARRIRDASTIFANYPHCLSIDIFKQIAFTVIYVDSVDLAFTFFDTQNNRGVPLHATDLLKAYHLRAVDRGDVKSKEALQNLCASRWEGIQQGASVMSHEQEFAPSLFNKFLWRARYWTGTRVRPSSHDALMEEFQKHTWASAGDQDTIPLYHSRHNRLGTALTLTPNGYGEIHTNRISLSPQSEELPFAIRQPINKGIGFFLFVDKYAALLRKLVAEPSKSMDVQGFREVYQHLMMANSLFLREIFLLASLMYTDQFDDEKLWEFSLWLEHALGVIRLEKAQVRYEAAQNFFKQGELNLLDVIASAFRPEQVIAHLKTYHHGQDVYSNENIESGEGVQGVYKQAVQNYFDQVGPLSSKRNWIETKLKGYQP